MDIVPEPRSILDLISRWDADETCPVPNCPFARGERWMRPEVDPDTPGEWPCPVHALEFCPQESRDEIKDGLHLTEHVRMVLGLNSPDVLNTLQPGGWIPAPVTLCGKELMTHQHDGRSFAVSGFFVRGFSEIPADELLARSDDLPAPGFFAIPMYQPTEVVERSEITQVHVYLAFAVGHVGGPKIPAAHLIRYWDWLRPHADFRESPIDHGALSAAQQGELHKVWTSLARGNGRPPLSAAERDARLIQYACRYMATSPVGGAARVTLSRFCSHLGLPESTVKDCLRGSTFRDWVDFRTRHLSARTVQVLARSGR